jgi:hypothetical protein
MDSQYSSATNRTGQLQISLKIFKGSHRTSISATKMLPRDDDDKLDFIRLNESADVDVSPAYSRERV